MPAHHVSARAFGIAQGIVLALILVSVVVFRRRQKGLSENSGTNFDSLNVHAAIRRATAGRTLAGAPPPTQKPEPPKPAPALESALPTWSKTTLPHEILGIAPDAAPAAVEGAFKKLLKKYHPDRFGADGKGYQKRAHHVVLMLQEARDKMLSKKS